MLTRDAREKIEQLNVEVSLKAKILEIVSSRSKEWGELITSEGFNVELLAIAATLPTPYQTPKITSVMGTVELFEHFRDLVLKLEATEFPDKAIMLHNLHNATESWRSMTAAIKQFYLRLPLFAPVIRNDGLFRYLSSGSEVLEADVQFGTSLHRDLPQMTRDRMQVYEWKGEPKRLMVLSRYRQRWILRSVWDASGEELSRSHPDVIDILERLRTHDVETPPELVDRLELFLNNDDFDISMILIKAT